MKQQGGTMHMYLHTLYEEVHIMAKHFAKETVCVDSAV